MKMLKRLFSLFRQRPQGQQAPGLTGFPPSLMDAEEFARLICSGRVEDLRVLARKLSAQPTARV